MIKPCFIRSHNRGSLFCQHQKIKAILMRNRLFVRLLARHSLFLNPLSPNPPSILLRNLSTVSETANENESSISNHMQNPFADFAATKFNLSPRNIESMFNRAPWLQRIRTLDRVEQFVNVLSENGFREEQIAKMMMSLPTYLTTSVGRIMEPKIRLFKEQGIQGEDLANILTTRPRILTRGLKDDLLPKMEILQNLFQSQDLFVKVVRRNSVILTHSVEETLKPSLAFWEGFGFSGSELTKLISSRPSLLQYSSLTPDKVDFFHKIGIDKENKMYQYVLVIMVTYPMKTLEAKVQNLQMCGLSEEKVFELLRVCPKALGFRADRVSGVMDFIVNTMELPAYSVVKYPQYLSTSLNKVIRPRFLVWRAMTSMYGRKQRKGLSLHGIIFMSEKRFLNDVLLRRPALYPIYEMALSNASEISSRA